MALTNRTRVEFFFENIIRDFDVLIVTKESKRLEKTNLLDILGEDFKALSVVYTYGPNAYALFLKGSVDISTLRNTLTEAHKDVTVRKVTLENLLDEEFCERTFFYGNRMLAQLLINSIRSPRDKEFSYNNLTGKLYYGHSSWIEKWGEPTKVMRVHFLQISLDKGMYLNLDVKTFKRADIEKVPNKRKYVFDPKTKIFRRMLDADKKADVFVEGSFGKSRKTIPYFNISSFAAFTKCKLGVLHKFLADVADLLGEYMSITLIERENIETFEETQKVKKDVTKAFMGSILNKKPITLVDLVNSVDSAELSGYIMDILNNSYGVLANITGISQEGYIIRIIHEPEYYKENELPDPYDDDLGSAITQHITVESLKDKDPKKNNDPEERWKKARVICDKVVQELILKNDVRQNMIAIYDWPNLSFDKTWSFVIREKVKDEKGDGQGTTAPYRDRYKYYMVQISPCGAMEFSSFENENIELCPVFERLAYEMRNYGDIGGFIFSDIENIHVIVTSKEKTMPNISAIWEGLHDTNDASLVNREELIDALRKITERDPERLSVYNGEIIEKLKEEKPLIKKKNLRSIIGIKKSIGKEINRSLKEDFGIWISPEMKNSEFEDIYCLSAVTNINYFVETDDNGVYFFCYFVGPKRKDLKQSIHNASIIRKVFAFDDRIMFKELLPLMSVDFVRNNMPTVMPFPFKYLREYKAMVKRREAVQGEG